MKKQEKFIEPWIDKSGWDDLKVSNIPTPSYVVSEKHLERNLKILNQVEKDTGVKILIALKSFSMFHFAPLISKYLSGAEASSINEARLGKEYFKGEIHTFSPSYTKENIKEHIKYSDHLVFNSFSQWCELKEVITKHNKVSFAKASAGRRKKVSCGMRVNLEHRESEEEMYDPSRPFSHFGVTLKNFEEDKMDGIEGLHFHNLCESSSEAFARSLVVFEKKFGKFFGKIKWVNFGGGHHITRPDYDINLLKKTILDFKKKYPHLEVYLEPGEAVALNAGVLVSSVVDFVHNEKDIAVLDVSATCHMPDVLEINYLPIILNGNTNSEGKYCYKFVGPTCLTGDVIGDYSFDAPLKMGDKIVFLNMAIYTMVKNNTFNGVDLPNIFVLDKKNKLKLIKSFSYKDFKNRLS